MSDKVRKALLKLIKETVPTISLIAKVKAVDEVYYTCDVVPIDGGAIYHDVRLKATIDGNDNGMISIPKVGSLVIISNLNNNHDVYYVSRFTSVIKWHLKIDSGSALVFDDQGNITFNNGNLGGLIKIDDLKTQWDANINATGAAIKAALTVIDTALNALASGSGQSLNAFNTAATSIQSLNKTTLENSKIKHG